MREIKFRAWHNEEERYEYLSKSYYMGGQVGMMDVTIGSDKAIWEQFTGLHDKNGKEIYEGDIVEWLDYETKRIGYVTFSPDLKFITSNHSFSFGSFAYQDTEKHLIVVSHIHESPELLEGAKDGKGLKNSKHVNSIYAEGNTSDVESSTNELNDLQKFYWTTKKNDNYGDVMHLKRDQSGSIERVPYAFHGENERLTEQEVIDEGYNPDYYVKEEVK